MGDGGTVTLPDLLSYDDFASYGLTRYGLDQLIGSGEFERIASGFVPTIWVGG